LNNLEFRHLKRFCDKYGIDYYEIDNTLTYRENKEHLRSLAHMLTQTLDMFEIEQLGVWRQMAEMQKQYMSEHFLSYYLAWQMAGETTATDIGPPVEPYQFSLKDYIKQGEAKQT